MYRDSFITFDIIINCQKLISLFIKCKVKIGGTILIVAGFFESCFAFCLGKMKGVVGLEYYFWGIGFLTCLALSMILLAKAIQTIPIGTAYPVWTLSLIHI